MLVVQNGIFFRFLLCFLKIEFFFKTRWRRQLSTDPESNVVQLLSIEDINAFPIVRKKSPRLSYDAYDCDGVLRVTFFF